MKPRNPATARLDDTPLYTLPRGKKRYPYATTVQLQRLLQRDYASGLSLVFSRGGAVLSEQERREITAIIETCSDKEDYQL